MKFTFLLACTFLLVVSFSLDDAEAAPFLFLKKWKKMFIAGVIAGINRNITYTRHTVITTSGNGPPAGSPASQPAGSPAPPPSSISTLYDIPSASFDHSTPVDAALDTNYGLPSTVFDTPDTLISTDYVDDFAFTDDSEGTYDATFDTPLVSDDYNSPDTLVSIDYVADALSTDASVDPYESSFGSPGFDVGLTDTGTTGNVFEGNLDLRGSINSSLLPDNSFLSFNLQATGTAVTSGSENPIVLSDARFDTSNGLPTNDYDTFNAFASTDSIADTSNTDDLFSSYDTEILDVTDGAGDVAIESNLDTFVYNDYIDDATSSDVFSSDANVDNTFGANLNVAGEIQTSLLPNNPVLSFEGQATAEGSISSSSYNSYDTIRKSTIGPFGEADFALIATLIRDLQNNHANNILRTNDYVGNAAHVSLSKPHLIYRYRDTILPQ